MNRQQILTGALLLTVGVCAALGVADYRLTQEIQEVEKSLGLSQKGGYPLGVRIEGADVESADSADKSEQPETTGSEI
jgi:hypothetical protein